MRPLESVNHQPVQSPNHQRLTGDFCTTFQQLMVVKQWQGTGNNSWFVYSTSEFSPLNEGEPVSTAVDLLMRKHWASAVVNSNDPDGTGYEMNYSFSVTSQFPLLDGEVFGNHIWMMGSTGYTPFLNAINVSADWGAFSTDTSDSDGHLDITLSGEITFDSQLSILSDAIKLLDWDYLSANPAIQSQRFVFKEFLSYQSPDPVHPDQADVYGGTAVEGDFPVTFDGAITEAVNQWNVVQNGAQNIVDIRASGTNPSEDYYMTFWVYQQNTTMGAPDADVGNSNSAYPIVGVRTRFKNEAPSPVSYFIAEARLTQERATAAPFQLDDVYFSEYGTLAAHHVKEIIWPDAMDTDFVVTDGSGRLSVGWVRFAILSELPSDWVTRTGIPMAGIPGGL